jgi:vacuolar-type H+-ATPase subunit E/Vma4
MNVDRLRATLLVEAEREAESLVASAEARAADERERAQAEAKGVVERAGDEGREAGELESARSRALARRRASRLVLEARRAVYEDFRRAAVEAVLALRSEDGYAALLARLSDDAREALGEDAELEVDPDGVGGVRARAGRRSVDLTLPTLAEGCMTRLGGRLEDLWR